MMEGGIRKRRIKVVDSPFQFRMIATFLAVVAAGFVVFSAGLFLFYFLSRSSGSELFRESIAVGTPAAAETAAGSGETTPASGAAAGTERGELQRASVLELILPPLLINNLAIMAFVIVVGIFASQRIAGPIYRMEMDIDRVLAGEKGVRVKIRKRDNFPILAEKVNGLIERSEKAADNRS